MATNNRISLLIGNPSLAAEWHPTKNGALTPNGVAAGSKQKVWWLGRCSHEWEAIVGNRNRGVGCPFCQNKRVLSGYNDLATTHPHLFDQWHPTKNSSLNPRQVSAGTNKLIWWLCGTCNYEWQAKATSRAYGGLGCPACAGKAVHIGFNDLVTKEPSVATQWHPVKNGSHLPTQFTVGSGKRAWWLCHICQHEWEAVITSRTGSQARGCPACSGQVVVPGNNTLADRHPLVASRWHPTKNGEITPGDVTSGTNKKAWWQCPIDPRHEWQSIISDQRRYGCPICSGNLVVSGINDLETLSPKIAAEWHPTKNEDLTATQVSASSNVRVWWLCEQAHEWKTTISHRTGNHSGCPRCRASSGEKALLLWLREVGVKYTQHDRTVLTAGEGRPREIDIYLPQLKLGIEYNGIYWHSERHKSRNFHYQKWADARIQNVQLIQIWEDDWLRNPTLVKTMLLHKMGLASTVTIKVGARKTKVFELQRETAQDFLQDNHVQGHSNGTYYLGLKTQTGQLVAVMVLKKEAGSQGEALTIIRYATNAIVPGGFTKLLTYVERTYSPKRLVTFSDHCVSDGKLYKDNGFIADKELPPDYMYVVSAERRHKFGYRLKRFRNDPHLQWIEGFTESQLAELNNLRRIWDAGKTRWVKEVN